MRKTKTKRLRKISKFTNKNRVAGMFQETTHRRNAFERLNHITDLLISREPRIEGMKREIIGMIHEFKQLDVQNQREFIKTLENNFFYYHHQNSIMIELYFMQIITLIDSTLSLSINPRLLLLAKESNDTMRKFSAKFMTTPPIRPPSERQLSNLPMP